MRSVPATSPSAEEDLVRQYLHEIGRHTLLTPDQEVSLAKAIEAGARARRRLENGGKAVTPTVRARLQRQIEEADAAHRRFVESNLRLVVSIARRFQGFGLPLLDLIQEGNIGLLRAVEKFDWHRGFRFSTYATWWIRQGITRGLADRARTIRLPVHVAEVVNRLRGVESDLEKELGREPSEAELARALDIDVDRLRIYRTAALDPVSLSVPLGEDGDSELHEFLEDEACEQPLDAAVRSRSAQELRLALGGLSERERRILELRFGFADGRTKTLDEIGREFGLTRERIRQIEAKAIAKLRHPAGNEELRAFLD